VDASEELRNSEEATSIVKLNRIRILSFVDPEKGSRSSRQLAASINHEI